MKRMSEREIEAQYRFLDLSIKRLERRGMHMTPTEQLRATELKKRRVVMKDLLYDIGHVLRAH